MTSAAPNPVKTRPRPADREDVGDAGGRSHQRTFPREACRVACDLFVAGVEHKALVTDLSARGMFLQTSLALDVGTELRLRLRPQEGDAIDVIAVVARKRRAHRMMSTLRTPGLGLELKSASEAYFTLVMSLVG